MKCCLCGEQIDRKYTEKGELYWDKGNNAQPLKEGRCCDLCDNMKVIPERLRRAIKERKEVEVVDAI